MTFKSKKQPLCRACGGAIPKRAETVWVYKAAPSHAGVSKHVIGSPRTKAEAQCLVNLKIISLRRNDDGFISRVAVWDEETYVDEFFCKLACSQSYANMAVRSRFNQCESVAYRDAVARQIGGKS